MNVLKYFPIITILLIITSCGSYQNFNKQKYTHLKKLHPTYGNPDYGTSQFNPVKESKPIETEGLENQPDLVVEQIKAAIEDGKSVFVKVENKLYRIDNPVYDSFYDAIIGSAVEVNKNDLKGKYIFLAARNIQTEFQLTYTYRSDIFSIVEREESNSEIDKVQPIVDNVPSRSEVNRKENVYANQAHFIKSEYGKKTRTSGFTALGSFAMIFLGLLFISSGVIAGVLIILLAYLATIVSLICMVTYTKKYKKETIKHNKKPFPGSKRFAIIGWFGLVLLSGVMLFLPLIIAGILVAVQ